MTNHTKKITAAALGIAGAALIGASALAPAAAQADPNGPGGPGGPSEPFITCMTNNGVPAPPNREHPAGPPPSNGATPPPRTGGGTPPPPPGVDQDVWDSALKACQSLAPKPPTQ